MPSFQDSIFLFILALLLFGPKRLPMLARELGKWIGEFRRASNEFKMQMEEELRLSDQAERLKKLEAIEASAPVTPALTSETAVSPTESSAGPEHPHLRESEPTIESTTEIAVMADRADGVAPLPIAVSGDLSIMPPATGLPTPRSKGSALGPLIESIPEVESIPQEDPISSVATNEEATETAAHGS